MRDKTLLIALCSDIKELQTDLQGLSQTVNDLANTVHQTMSDLTARVEKLEKPQEAKI